uniref:MPN domain-containing protein n=1 Tax=Araucaria cunninghamii TaxID=56994 RepID=A0A0D6R5U9_ARACU
MSLIALNMSEEVWLTCLTHALSTETEEIMGLLFGDIEYLSNGSATALVWGAAPQTRSDRRKDRVETNPEQLAAASAQAEKMSTTIGRTTRVIGWYHSHPHITVLPSHVDVRTQAMYQLLDPGFIGVIFSCFSEDAQKVGRIQVIAFQALDGKQRHLARIPVQVGPSHIVGGLESMSARTSLGSPMPKSTTVQTEIIDLDPVNPKASSGVAKVLDRTQTALDKFFDHADAESSGRRDKTGQDGRSITNDLDSMDLTSRMQEAVLRSNLDVSGAEYVRKEVPLAVVPGHSLAKLDFSLSSYVDLHRILFTEEKVAYKQAMSQSTKDGKIHPLAAIHHSSQYQSSMCKLMEYCLSPVISSLWDRLEENKLRLTLLQEEAVLLELDVLNKGNPNVQSQKRSSNRSAVYAGSPEPKPSIGSLSNMRGSSGMSSLSTRQSSS